MPGVGPQQHRIPRQDRLRPATADPVGESQQDHKPRYIQKIIYMHLQTTKKFQPHFEILNAYIMSIFEKKVEGGLISYAYTLEILIFFKIVFLNTNCKGLCLVLLCRCIMSFPITGLFISTLCKSCPNIKFLSMMNNEAAPSYFNGGTYQQYADYRYKVLLAWMVCGWPARPYFIFLILAPTFLSPLLFFMLIDLILCPFKK